MADDKKPKPKVPDKADDKEQSERFIETARDHEADEGKDAMDQAFRRVTSRKAPSSVTHRGRKT